MDEYMNPTKLAKTALPCAATLLAGIAIGYLNARFRMNRSLRFVFYALPVCLMTLLNAVTDLSTVQIILFSVMGHYFGDCLIAIGLTGGIATGKSSVSAEWKKLNAVIIDADLIARQVVEPGKPAYNKIVAMFGQDVLNPDKTINRPILGSIIFNNPAKRQALNSCTHRYIIIEMFYQLLYHRIIRQRSLVVFDAPLLYETKLLQYFCSPIVVVACSEKNELDRLMARDHLTEDKAQARIKSQMSLADKAQLADIVLDNNGTRDDLIQKAEETLRQIASAVGAASEVQTLIESSSQ